MPVKEISFLEREQIQKLLKEGYSCRQIGEAIGRSKNAIVVEVKRNGGKEKYTAKKSQDRRDNAKKSRVEKLTKPLTEAEHKKVLELIDEKFSFTQICEKMGIHCTRMNKHFTRFNLKQRSRYGLQERLRKLEDQVKLLTTYIRGIMNEH